MLTFKQFLKEDLKRVGIVGGSTIGASAATGAITGLGAVPGAAIGALYYTLSGELKKDFKKKSGDWNYKKKKNLLSKSNKGNIGS